VQREVRSPAEHVREGDQAKDVHPDGEEAEGECEDDTGFLAADELQVADDEDGEGHDGEIREDVEGADEVPEGDLVEALGVGGGGGAKANGARGEEVGPRERALECCGKEGGDGPGCDECGDTEHGPAVVFLRGDGNEEGDGAGFC
jgi:hypothetical protein